MTTKIPAERGKRAATSSIGAASTNAASTSPTPKNVTGSRAAKQARRRPPASATRTMQSADATETASSGRDIVIGRVIAVAAVIALLAAIGGVAFAGYRAYQVYAVQNPIQQTRDEATAAAEQVVINVTTIDPNDLAGFKSRAEESLTGKARDEVLGGKGGSVLAVLEQPAAKSASLTSKLVKSAPTEVNADEHTASVLVYVVTTLKRKGQQDVNETRGFNVGMVREDGKWKAAAVTPLEGVAYQDEAGQPGGGN